MTSDEMHYTMVVQWSDEDQTFVVLFPDLADEFSMPATDGETYEKAVKRGQNALENMLEVLKKEGKPLPRAKTYA